MKREIRNELGQISEYEYINLDVLLNTYENESYRDYKIDAYDVRFPETTEDLNGDVHIWNLNDNK